MESLVRLRTRPSRDGKTFKYFLDYKDENGKRRQVSLQHANRRKSTGDRSNIAVPPYHPCWEFKLRRSMIAVCIVRWIGFNMHISLFFSSLHPQRHQSKHL